MRNRERIKTSMTTTALSVATTLLVAAFVVALVVVVGRVAPGDVTAFAAYLGGFVVVPGTIVWRLLSARSSPLVLDVAFGTLVGLALEVPVQLVAVRFGEPRLALVWPAAVIAAGALSMLRRRAPATSARTLFRLFGMDSVRLPQWWVVGALALVVAAEALLLAHGAWAIAPATGATLQSPYIDEGFHLALTAELMTRGPEAFPYVVGQPLEYHWFTYAHVANAAALTGIEPAVLLRVLAPLALLIAATVAIAATVYRVVRRAVPSVLAAALFGLGSTLDVYGWTRLGAPWAGGFPTSRLNVLSPTQTYGLALSVLVIVIVLDVLSRDTAPHRPALRSRWRWVALLGALVALAGAKSTFPPIVVAGLVGAAAVTLVRDRGRARPALLAVGGSLAVTLWAPLVIYGTGSRELTWSPLTTAENRAVALDVATRDSLRDGSTVFVVVVALAYVASQLLGKATLLGLVRRGPLQEPAHVFLLVAGLAGLGGALAFHHPGGSQMYFAYSAPPFFAVAAGLGAATLMQHLSRRAMVTLVGWGAAGVAVALVVTVLSSRTGAIRQWPGATALLAPPLLGIGIILVLVLAVHRLRRFRAVPAVAAVLVALLGMSQLGSMARVAQALRPVPAARASPQNPHIGTGGIEAATWLRDRSGVRDLVATNAHCFALVGKCDARHFWIAGWSQRRVLVEGWAYVSRASHGGTSSDPRIARPPFWDPPLLAANDLAFSHPSADTVGFLVRQGVRWLFVDTRWPADVAGLAGVATLRHQTGDYVVLELPDSDPAGGR